ncbi:MAG: ATP-binding protein [Psychrosphaera sp.]|nr:ATP-binding protein [Psychrosphaera sp.]
MAGADYFGYTANSANKRNPAGFDMTTARVKYPLGIQTFSEIREENYLYVDKTAIIHDLITTGKLYFFSRPRRFGKSLLISTLEALFNGQRDLFNGLDINNTDYDFATYPVLKLEFSQDEFRTADSLRKYIYSTVDELANRNGIALSKETYNQRFAELIKKLHQSKQQKVVVLIDEYDKPILNHFNSPELAEVKKVMSAFYAVIKPLDEHLKFIFITGVSKFAKVSVFSGMNSLRDISMNRQYASLCGITQQELEDNFMPAITQLAEQEASDTAKMLGKIKYWYNGYRFHHLADGVYNPFSLLSLFLDKEFLNYWYTTGTPTFLLDLLQSREYDLTELTERKVGAAAFDASDPQNIEIQSLFVQTGYLTIKDYNEPLYQLDFPNFEVKKSFYDSVAARYSQLGRGMSQGYTFDLMQFLQAGNIDDFITTLKTFFANIPYDLNINLEKYYQSLFYAIFTLLGLTIDAEVRTNEGRIDCVLQTDDAIYIIEFKLNDSCEAALQQIHDKNYAQKYQRSDKNVVLLGVEFDQKTRNLGKFIRQDVVLPGAI